jgi:hypothetical protein
VNGRTRLGGGVQFFSNPVTLGVNYQTVFTPLATGFLGRQVTQAWTINLDLRLWGGARLRYDTYLDPAGRTRYTAAVRGVQFGTRQASPGNPPSRSSVVSLPRFIVSGIVQDESGDPVSGIAVDIGGEMIFSDSSGRFFVRKKSGGEYPLRVLFDQSLNPREWVEISAPKQVTAWTEAEPALVRIILRPAPNSANLR